MFQQESSVVPEFVFIKVEMNEEAAVVNVAPDLETKDEKDQQPILDEDLNVSYVRS